MQKVAKRFAKICWGHDSCLPLPPNSRKPLDCRPPKMDTKTQLLELIRELGEATVLATQLAKNIDWLAGLGHDIAKLPEPKELTAAAVDLRCKIDRANFNVIANAPKY